MVVGITRVENEWDSKLQVAESVGELQKLVLPQRTDHLTLAHSQDSWVPQVGRSSAKIRNPASVANPKTSA